MVEVGLLGVGWLRGPRRRIWAVWMKSRWAEGLDGRRDLGGWGSPGGGLGGLAKHL